MVDQDERVGAGIETDPDSFVVIDLLLFGVCDAVVVSVSAEPVSE